MISRFIPADERATDPSEPVLTLRIVGADSIAAFRYLLHRGTNVWDNAPVEVKELADMVIHQRLLQNYSELPPNKVSIPAIFFDGLPKK